MWNIHFDELRLGQIVIGALGLALALFFVLTLQENPRIQRAAVFGMMAVEVVMTGPPVWQVFTGDRVHTLQIAVAAVGAILMFVNWRMLPREGLTPRPPLPFAHFANGKATVMAVKG